MVRKNWTVFFADLSVLSLRVIPLWRAVFVRRIRRRAFGCQAPVGGVPRLSSAGGRRRPCLSCYRLVCAPIDFFLLEAVPEALHVHIARPQRPLLSIKICTPRDQYERRATLATEVRTAVGESKSRDKEGYTRKAYVPEMLRSAAAADVQTIAAALIAVVNSLPSGGRARTALPGGAACAISRRCLCG